MIFSANLLASTEKTNESCVLSHKEPQRDAWVSLPIQNEYQVIQIQY